MKRQVGNQKILLALRNIVNHKLLRIAKNVKPTNLLHIYATIYSSVHTWPTNIQIQVGYKELCIHMASEHGGLEEVILIFLI